MTEEELRDRFYYHAPSTDGVRQTHEKVSAKTYVLASWLNLLPESREKALAMTHLEEVRVWANACVARHQVDLTADPGDQS